MNSLTEWTDEKLIQSPVGPLTLRLGPHGLTHLLFGDVVDRRVTPGASTEARQMLAQAATQLAEYFAGRRREFTLPLAPRGTAFQIAVWQQLRRIPYGRIISYGELAKRIDRPQAVRAVGAANGANPIAIIVPCHRVIGAAGRLTGYGGGLSLKRHLLELEGLTVDGNRVVAADPTTSA